MRFDFLGHLWMRLFVAVVAPVAIAIVSVAVLANFVALGQFDQFIQQDVQQRDDRLLMILNRYRAEQGSWVGVNEQVQRLSVLVGERIVVTDGNGKVVADSSGQLLGQQEGRNWRRATAIDQGETRVGTLFINPTLPGRASSLKTQAFLSGVNRSLLLGTILAAILSLLISFLLSRTLRRQLESIVHAARRIGRGDLSQRVRSASGGELGELAAAINGMAEDLQRSLRLRQQMVADVAHELRTPLQNISGYLEAIKDGVADANEHTLGVLTSETEHLRHMVDDLQDLSLAESGSLAIDLVPVRLQEQAVQVLSSVGARAEEEGITLSNELPPDLPEVIADERRSRQVISNLVANALKYTPTGGRVWLSGSVSGGEVEICVSDTGVGIAAADQPYVFERFFRVDPARARATGGAGLGLTIARELVQAMHGHIGVRSREAEGSQFWVRLPLAHAPVTHRPRYTPSRRRLPVETLAK